MTPPLSAICSLSSPDMNGRRPRVDGAPGEHHAAVLPGRIRLAQPRRSENACMIVSMVPRHHDERRGAGGVAGGAPKISPTPGRADSARLGDELARISDADWVHVDVMDNH